MAALRKVIFTIKPLGDMDHSRGLSYAYEVKGLPSPGAGFDRDTGEVWIDGGCPSGKYTFEYRLIAFIEETVVRPGRATTTAAAEWSSEWFSWDFEVVANVMETIRALGEHIYLGFDGISLCSGDCTLANKWIKIEELTHKNDSEHDYINETFTLTQVLANDDEIKWELDSGGLDCQDPYSEYPVYYERDFGAAPFGQPGETCECDNGAVISSVKHATLNAHLKYLPDEEFEIGEGKTVTGAYTFKVFYDGAGGNEFGDLFNADYLLGDPMEQLSATGLANVNVNCKVGGGGDNRVVGVGGECKVGFEGCDGNIIPLYCIAETPTPLPSCTFTATFSASHTVSATVSSTEADTSTASASHTEQAPQECFALFGLPACDVSHGWTGPDHAFAILLESGNTTDNYMDLLAGEPVLKIGTPYSLAWDPPMSGCYNGQHVYYEELTDVPLVYIDANGNPQYCDHEANVTALRSMGAGGEGLFPPHDAMWNALQNQGVYVDIADFDPTYGVHPDCKECDIGISETASATSTHSTMECHVALVSLKACSSAADWPYAGETQTDIVFLLDGSYAAENYTNAIGGNVIEISGKCYTDPENAFTDAPLIRWCGGNDLPAYEFADGPWNPNSQFEKDMSRLAPEGVDRIPFHRTIWDQLENYTVFNSLEEVINDGQPASESIYEDCEDCIGPTPSPATATASASTTASASVTVSATASESEAPSPTVSVTATVSEGDSPTATPSLAQSGSATASGTISATASATESESATATETFSVSATPTVSEGDSHTATATVSVSVTASATASDPYITITTTATASASEGISPTESASVTESASASRTPTASESGTPTASASEGISPTATDPYMTTTPTATASASEGVSPTESASVTESASASETPTASESGTPTASASEGISPTESASVTATASASEGVSPTSTDPYMTSTPTASEGVSPTESASASRTPTASASEGISPTATASASEGVSPTLSATATASASEGVSPTESASVTESASASETPTASESGTPTASASEGVSPTSTDPYMMSTPTATASVSVSATATATAPTPTASASASATASESATATASGPTPSESATATASAPTPSDSATASASATATASASATATEPYSGNGGDCSCGAEWVENYGTYFTGDRVCWESTCYECNDANDCESSCGPPTEPGCGWVVEDA